MHSGFPVLWSSRLCVAFNLSVINCTTSVTKASPLSEPIDTGIPNHGMILFNRHLATSWTFSVKWGRLSSILRRCRQIPANIYNSSLLGFVSGTQPALFMQSYKCWRAWGHKNAGQGGLKSCLSWVSSFMELFVKCGSQWCRYDNVVINKLPPSVQ
jgi:hypothetical protein